MTVEETAVYILHQREYLVTQKTHRVKKVTTPMKRVLTSEERVEMEALLLKVLQESTF